MGTANSFLHIYVSVLLIGMGCIHLTAFGETGPDEYQGFSSDTDKSIDVRELEGPPNGQSGWIIVEPVNVLPSDNKDVINVIPYKFRRKKWGQTFSVAYSMFAPVNMESHLGALYFSDIYDSNAETPMTELQFALKRNMFLGSIAAEVGLGYYSNQSDSDLVSSKLEIIPLRVGLNYTADAIFELPYIAPYIGGGGYIFRYTEKQGSTSFNGTTQVALYATVGANFSIDWIDRRTAAIAYLDGGIESTSLFVEARKYFSSAEAADPDFETEWDGQAGLRLEF